MVVEPHADLRLVDQAFPGIEHRASLRRRPACLVLRLALLERDQRRAILASENAGRFDHPHVLRSSRRGDRKDGGKNKCATEHGPTSRKRRQSFCEGMARSVAVRKREHGARG
ncbi:hypothetical protein W911_12930 [Hyphomicrobium nitrativorans NL23]|uniref:Uncharacterized protein n=1 Tax=Hyphomicrobium nitrativorans NL23 TaxID=1029756 RepID=V5SIE7_9HYPH|nr:hypothetical protein W911_12930 [Hyphomicrobium nitrativorans NL23]